MAGGKVDVEVVMTVGSGGAGGGGGGGVVKAGVDTDTVAARGAMGRIWRRISGFSIASSDCSLMALWSFPGRGEGILTGTLCD